MALNPKITDQGSKVLLEWTPVTSGQGYRFYVDGVAVSRTFKPDQKSTTFSKPDGKSHRYGVQVMDVLPPLEEVAHPAAAPPAGFAIDAWGFTSTPTTNDYQNQSWVLYTSDTVPDGHWGSDPIRQIRTPPAGGSWEWWYLYELWLGSSFPSTSSSVVVGLDAHNVPGDVGWDDGASGVSSILYKMKNGTFHIQHERQQDAGSGQHEFEVFTPSREVWHSLTVQHILGRLDGSVPASGHPNGGKGRTRCLVNGALELDTGDINLLHRHPSTGKVQTKMDMLHGIYNIGNGSSLTCRMTAARVGRTKEEALGDSNMTLEGLHRAATGAHTVTQLADRSSSDFRA